MTTSDGPSQHVKLHHLGGAADAVALICVPYAGGSTAIFRSWPKSLPSVDFYALGLPGREARLADPPFTALEPLVASAVEVLQPLAQRPFALFGHSMGGLIAFETARRLHRKSAAAPIHLFVSGFRAPHLSDPTPPLFDLPRPEFLDELRRLNVAVFDPSDHLELIDLMIPTLRADFRLVQTYVYNSGPMLTCPITAFGGSHDSEVSDWQLREWRQHTSAAFMTKVLPGGHFFLQTAGQALLEEIRRQLS